MQNTILRAVMLLALIDEGCQGFDNLAGEANYLSHELFDENGKKKARLPHLGDDKYWDPKTRAGEKIHQLVDVVSAALLKDPINWDYIKQLTIADIADARKDAADNKWQWGYEGVGYAGNNLRILEVGLGNQLHSMSTILTAAEHADLVRCAETAGLKNIEIGNLGKEYRQNIAIELNTDPITRNTGALNTPNHIAFVTNEDDVIEAAASVSRVVFEVSSAENDLYKVKILGNEAWQAGIDCACAIITGIKDDPSTGQTVDVSTIVEKVQELLGDGVDQIILQDTNGTATPDDITALLKAIKKEKIALDKIGIQCRDQNGNGLAKVRAAIGGGITEIVTSIGGVNGSGKGITRDIATESVVTLLTESGIEHGYDRPKLRKLETDVRKLLSFPVEHTPDQQHTRA